LRVRRGRGRSVNQPLAESFEATTVAGVDQLVAGPFGSALVLRHRDIMDRT
jgi:hypothetical protein